MFIKNREKLIESLSTNSVCIVCSGDLKIRSNDTEYMPFRPNSDFLYLTGFDEPESILVIQKGVNETKTTLFLRPKDKKIEIWTGYRLGLEAAPQKCSVDQAEDIETFQTKIKELMVGFHHLYFDMMNVELHSILLNSLKSITNSRGNKKPIPFQFNNLSKFTYKQRLIKTESEIDLIKSACKITKETHIKLMRESHRCNNERELLAIINHTFTDLGATYSSYHSIVASGKNALCLHYIENNKTLNDQDLILVDAGAEFDYYSSDVTRTFPKGKTFSAEQKIIYDIVLKAQKDAILYASKGKTLTDIHDFTSNILLEGLLEYKILKNSKEEILEKNLLKQVYPHGTSHFLGMDVHDQNTRFENEIETTLDNGMIFTVEPGLYLYPDLDINEKFKGIGIRIEDDILIKDNKSFNLTSDIPKEILEIESIKK